MRKHALVGVGLLAGLLGTASPAFAAGGPVPTCLIANGAGMTKSLLCANLVAVDGQHAGHGRYSPGKVGGTIELTVTIEFRRDAGDDDWEVLADATVWGVGPVEATTRPVSPHGVGSFRACVTETAESVPGDGHQVTHSLCATSDPAA
jgi:hypothetical protein